MTYKELQAQLKTFKSQGLTTIALNAKKDVLEAEYDRIMNSMIKDAFATEYDPEIVEDEETNGSTISDLDLQDQLRIWSEQGLTTIALDSSELELHFEFARIMGDHFAIPEEEVIAKIEKNVFATEFEPEIIETVSALEDTDNEIIPTGNEAIIEDTEAIIEVMNETNEAMGIVIGINEAVTVKHSENESKARVTAETDTLLPPKDTEVTSTEFIEALSKLLIIFVSSIVKLWLKVNRIR